MPAGALPSNFLFPNPAAKVGPEFLGYIANRAQQDVGAPDAECIAERALALWMVQVRNTGRHAVAHDLRVIELRFAAVGARDDANYQAKRKM